MSDSNYNQDADDATAENALRQGLKARALTPEALQRIREATRAEWHSVHGEVAPAQARRPWLSIAAAATVAALSIGIGWNMYSASTAAPGAVLGSLVRFEAPGVAEPRYFGRDVFLSEGSELRAGQSLDVRGDALVTLAGGGNLRVARASVIDVVAAGTVKLERGELYVDIPPGSRGSDRFVVVTPAGEFRHVGTQFAVAIVNGATRLRVREGTVQWFANDADQSTVNAGTEVTIDQSRIVTRHPIATAGRDWAWAETLAPEVEIEDRPLQEFLEWFARETGRKLVIADDAVRRQAVTIRMHGNVRGLTAVEALTAVMAATTLRFELPEGLIRVSSARESTTPAT